MGQVSRLRAEHAALRGAAVRLLTMTETEAQYRAVATGLLCDLAESLDTHAESETTVDYDRLDTPGCTQRPLAERLLGFQIDWEAFIDAWPSSLVARDWPGFSTAARAILPRLIEIIDAEDALLARAGSRVSAAG